MSYFSNFQAVTCIAMYYVIYYNLCKGGVLVEGFGKLLKTQGFTKDSRSLDQL